ncbi:hypothetical protein BH10CHL1_BH10CHL1_41080 [soil metagenome]
MFSFIFCFVPFIIFAGVASLFFRPFWGWRMHRWHHRRWGYRPGPFGWRRRW